MSNVNLEKDLQTLTEENLEVAFGLKFITTEFALGGFRVDTLAFDYERKAFVIIEYKKDKNYSVIDQGYSYLALLLNNKADFVLQMNEATGKVYKKEDFEWGHSRVIFVAGEFTSYQLGAMNFQGLPIELWEAKMFEKSLLSYNQIKPVETSESITSVAKKNAMVAKVTREVRTYTESDLFNGKLVIYRDLYEMFKERVLTIDDRLRAQPFKSSISFITYSNNYVCWITPQNNKLEVGFTSLMRKDMIEDPENKVFYTTDWSSRTYANVLITNESDVDYAVYIARQVNETLYK